MLTIDSEPSASKSLQVRGVAKIEIVDGVPREYIAASSKAMKSDQLAQFEKVVRSVYHEMARMAIEPTWARFYDFSTGRLPTFLRQLTSERKAPCSTRGSRKNYPGFPCSAGPRTLAFIPRALLRRTLASRRTRSLFLAICETGDGLTDEACNRRRAGFVAGSRGCAQEG